MLLVVFGTRPEWLKIRPVIDAIEGKIPYRILFTSQHTDIVDESLKNYKYIKLQVKEDSQENRLDSVCFSIMSQIDAHLKDITHVMVQGDTTTVFSAALSAFHRKIPVIHLEAGLRTWDNNNPYPEEFNRQAVGAIADIHLCPTQLARQNLLNEDKHHNSKIYVVGNTAIDNLNGQSSEGEEFVLVTLHRRENHNIAKQWFENIEHLAKNNKNLSFILPMHPNPSIIKHKSILKTVKVLDPLPHKDLLRFLKKSKVVITDSGGIQEESAFFRKPCIVCREYSERKEGLGDFSWCCKKPQDLFDLFERVKDHKIDQKLTCPYGDGRASQKILRILHEIF